MECDSVCGLWLTRAGNNDEKNAGRDDNVGVCHIIDQGGALRSALRVLISASIIPKVQYLHQHDPKATATAHFFCHLTSLSLSASALHHSSS